MSHAIELPTDIRVPKTSLWSKLPVIGGVLAVVGLGATFGTAFGEHGGRALFSYLWAFLFFLSIALGGFCWVLIEHVTRSGWSAALRRIGETSMATLPLFALLFIPLATFGFHELYPWSHHVDPILAKKRWFLSTGFWLGRAVFYFVVWIVISRLLHAWSTRQDAATDPAERERLTRKMWKLSAAGIILFALTQSFAAIDWLMSLQPHWYSTIFGIYFFAGSMLGSFAFVSLVSQGLQADGMIRKAVTTEHYHDLGKYVFGFTIFWAYIAFSQFLLIWYANIPEETEFYLARLSGGWEYISYGLPLAHFAVPFVFLLSRHVKRNRTLLALGSFYVLFVHAVDLFWVVVPNFGAHGAEAHEPHFSFVWQDLAAFVGVGGAFLALFGFFLTKHAVIAINDPRLPESLAHENY